MTASISLYKVFFGQLSGTIYSLWKMLDCVLFVLEVIFLTTAIWDAKITILFMCKEGQFLI